MVTFSARKNCWAMSVFILMFCNTLFAQQKNYQLSELADAAKNNLPVLKQKQALLNSAKASVTDTRHSFLPQFRVSDQINIGTDNSIAGSYLPVGVTISSSAGVRAENNYQSVTGNFGALYGEYDLITFGLNNAKIKNAEAYVDLQQSDFERQLYLIQSQIARTYFILLKTQYRLNADVQNVNRYDSIFTVIQALAASGIKAGADSSLSKAELSRAKITSNQTLGAIAQLKDELAYLTGIPATQLIIDSLAESFNSKKIPVFAFVTDSSNNPLLDYYKKQTKIYQTNQSLISKSYFPKILIAGITWARGSGIQYNDDYKSLSTGLGYQRFNYMAGLSVTYNLFNGLYRKDRLAINRFELQASNFELEQQKLALDLNRKQADNDLLTNENNLAELPVQLKSAEDTYRQKLAQYKAGIISLIDLTNASFVLYRSQTDYIETLSDWYLAQLDKATATGNLLQFIQTIK